MYEMLLPFFLGLALGLTPDTAGDAADAGVALSAAASTETATGQFTTAAEVRPILEATRGNWVAVRNYQGQDLVYFTHLLSWRCGLQSVRYRFNDAEAATILTMEPCYSESNAPNSMRAVEEFLPYVVAPGDSVDTVWVELTYDDATVEAAEFSRAEVLIP